MTIAPPVPPALARIAAIQARFGATPLNLRVTPSATPVEGPSTAAAFAQALGTAESAASAPVTVGETITPRSIEATPDRVGRAGTDGDDVVSIGREYEGIPYLWGGTDPKTGLDCSGFVQNVFRRLGVELPRVSKDQARVGVAVESLAEARPGDLVCFGDPVDHIGIYVGNGQLLQAPQTGDVVRIKPIRRDITAIRRVIPPGQNALPEGTGATPAPRPTSPPAAAPPASTVAQAGRLATVAAAPVPTSGAPTTGPAVAGPLDLRGLSPAAATYAPLFQEAGAKYGLPPRLLAAVAQTESNFNPTVRSSAGAVGLMQFMPATAQGMGIDPLDPAQAVDGAARYLSTQLRDFGSVELALAAYNAGPGAVRRAGGVPPFAETQNYIRKVLSLVGGAA